MGSESDAALSPSHVLELAAKALGSGGEEESRQLLHNPYEAVSLLGHACMAAAGFRLVGLGEEGHIAGM